MYLKRLQTVGFKSFAERIDIQFNEGITAIVGPNGSGKSNIIDAVRWVLGEQSVRSLRGQRMEDIIFQGSDTRNAMNFAEVTLTLDNASATLPLDYEEVSVTRRVYRSGESEFFINKQACRLKDIIELFIDSGLGKEAFSIISQGKVEQILISKADDRRVIFEEAAGVLKYKQRKQEAEFKLFETEENLNRVEDIIHEVEQQINPLKKQAEKAKQYNLLTEKLKQIEISLLITEIKALHDEWQERLKTIDKKRLQEVAMKTNIQEREAKLTENRHLLQQLDEEINGLQGELLEVTEQLEKFEGEKNVLDERLKHYIENKEKLKEEKQVVYERKLQLNKQLKEERKKLHILTKEKETTLCTIDELKEKLVVEEENLYAEIDNLKSDYIEQLNKRAVMQNERETVKRDIEKLTNRHLQYRQDYEHVIDKREKLQSEMNELLEQIKKTKTLYNDEKKNSDNLLQKHNQMTSQFNGITQKHYDAAAQLTKLTTRRDTLAEMKESYQGYFFGVRELLKRTENQQQFNIYGTVFDIMKVPHKYVTAIDTILGAQAQHIVIQTEHDAREAIDWLKRNNKGRATFLPLNAIKSRLIPEHIYESIKHEKGFIGIASELIMVEQQLTAIAQHVLGNVIIATTLREANTIARLTNRKYRIVTLDGDVVYPGGSMSGGARKRSNESLFTREKDLQQITASIKKQHEHVNNLTATLGTVQDELNKLNGTIENKMTKIKDYEKKLAQLKMIYDRTEITVTSLNEELKSYDLTVKHEEKEKHQLIERDDQLVKSLKTIGETLTETEKTINKLTEKAEQHEDREKMYEQQLHKLEITLAEQEERLKNETDKIHSLQLQLNETKKQYESLILQLEDLHEIKVSEEQKQMTKQKIKQQLNFRDVTILTLTDKRKSRKTLNEQIDDEQRDLREEHKLHQTFVMTIQDEEVKANRLDVALDTRLTHLEKQYVITYEKASEQYERVNDVNEATAHVNELKRLITQLGTVNLGAIEQYEQIVERFNFLTEQQEDLVDAKDTLYSIIKKMDEEMIKRFSTTFAHIQQAFTDVFKELFGGGHAKLQLTDETNLLETGIEIVARPPGKKLRTLDLLSGGEKALTAISLLFAILRVRPVPFVILDEVEAALDEANIVRFAKYLKMYRDETQFIVITHRKGTMEEADVLYGVTMQESGVSRLVSVRLEDTEQLVPAN